MQGVVDFLLPISLRHKLIATTFLEYPDIKVENHFCNITILSIV